MKKTLLCLFAWCFVSTMLAQTKFPYDSVAHSVVYKQALKLNAKAKTDDVFAATQTWFNEPAPFTQKNADPPIDSVKAKKNKNKIEVDKEFNNNHPLQMLEPESGKLVGLGLLKYYGGTTTSIKLLYLKYDIYVQIKQGVASISISNIRYFHFDSKSYGETGLYGFGGGKPCDQVGKIEDLIPCQKFPDEFKNLALYFNKETANLFTAFKTMLKQKQFLYDSKVSTPPSNVKKPAVKK